VVLSEKNGKQKVIKTIGHAKENHEIIELEKEAEKYIALISPQRSFDFSLPPKLSERHEKKLETLLSSLPPPQVDAVGPELVLGKLFDKIGFGTIEEPLFRALVLSRLTYPLSKLKTSEYIYLHNHEEVPIDKIYRFLDRFHIREQERVQNIAFEWTKQLTGKKIGVIFYDMTTLHFEAEDEDDLRKTGFSKNGKFQCPQIVLGLLVAENGYPIGYDIFSGNTHEGKTLIPFLRKIEERYGLGKPIVIADSGLLSKLNIKELTKESYEFILGARIKNSSEKIKKKILESAVLLKHGDNFELDSTGNRLIVGFSDKRAKKDAHNRLRGIARLEKRFKSGKLTKKDVNNRGYNKFVVLKSKIDVSIDYCKIADDSKWDGLKGYITNSKLRREEIIENYGHLWQIEKAFRISKTDLRIRPIYHRKQDRISAHICIAFVAYSVFKTLEKILKEKLFPLSPQKSIEILKTIYKITYVLSVKNRTYSTFASLTAAQQDIIKIFETI